MPRRRVRTRIERDNAANLGDDYKFTRDPELAEQRAENRRQRAASASRAKFTICAIRGCRANVVAEGAVSVCVEHAVDIWEIVEKRDKSPFLREVLGEDIARRDRIRAEQRAATKAEDKALIAAPDAIGEIYYIKVGGLIKVGWTSDLRKRLRAYGPEAEVLVHYEATRRDEANLHRQLKPSRAKGREWYQDDPIIQAFVTRAVREHGPPQLVRLAWTGPARDALRVKSWR